MADENTDTLAAAATGTVQGMTPQFTGPMTQFGNTAPNIPPPVQFQPPQQQQFAKPQGSFATVGERKRADRQSIIQNTTQLVKAGADYIQQNKMRSLSMDIERLMEASHGREEAMAALQQNPNDPQAKAALEKNTQIINTIAADPKKNKLIGKAFNVDLFGGGKNQKENAAMIDAWKSFNAKQQQGDKTALNPIAQRLAQSQPQRLGLSPEAAQQAAMIKAGLVPGADKILQANMEVYKTLQNAKTAEEKNASMEKLAQLHIEAEKYKADKVLDGINARIYGQYIAEGIKAQARMYSADKSYNLGMAKIQAMKDVANTKNANPIFKQLYQQKTSVTNELGKIIQENKGYESELAKRGTMLWGLYRPKVHSSAEEHTMTVKMQANIKLMEDLQQQNNIIDQRMSVLNKLGIDTGEQEKQAGSEENPQEFNPDENN